MAELSLRELRELGFVTRILGDENVRVRGVRHDSRRCEPGDLFLAVAGAQSDGAQFVNDAIARGAVAVLAERPLTEKVPVAVADDALVALSRIAQRLYDDPTSRLEVVGVTGTNGKTTITYLVESLLKADNASPAVLGTVNFRGPFGVLAATHTTPMADDLMRLSRAAVDSGASHLVIEVSSHALAMHRADGVHFAVAAFTNLTQDHLDYHGDFAHYEAAKRRLFRDLQPKAAAVNVDDAVGRSIADEFARGPGRVLRCSKQPGRNHGHDVFALSSESSRAGIRARISCAGEEFDLESPLIGEHNLENLLVALGVGVAPGIPGPVMQRARRDAQGAPGRLERVPHPHDVLVFVDYAHTPDALARVLQTVRKSTTGRLIVTFGCGGDRDPGKRPIMGKGAAELADLVVLTSDNPRSEDPARILQQIEAGAQQAGMPLVDADALAYSERGYCVEADRHAAIRLVLRAAQPGDTVLIAGKGHEKVQIIGDERIAFDDVLEARAVLEGPRLSDVPAGEESS
jgi:UDP-N-acetylmuramoyl-L-alanyl-D-glutamate--2,6-diaminopimelate ligase